MPGYIIHYACCNEELLKNRDFVLGLEMPDLLKSWYEKYGLKGSEKKYNEYKTTNMPSFSVFKNRIQHKEDSSNLSLGMHFGKSSHANIDLFIASIPNEYKDSLFYYGYFWHLICDVFFYTYINVQEMVQRRIVSTIDIRNTPNDYNDILNKEIEKIHTDWDKLNGLVLEKYPYIELSPEITELGIVKTEQGETDYIDKDLVFDMIFTLHRFNYPIMENHQIYGILKTFYLSPIPISNINNKIILQKRTENFISTIQKMIEK